MKIRLRTLTLTLLAIVALSFCFGIAYGLQTPPTERDKRPASMWYVNDRIARLQEQIDETRRGAWDKVRVNRRLDEFEARLGELERELNELDVAVRALGRER